MFTLLELCWLIVPRPRFVRAADVSERFDSVRSAFVPSDVVIVAENDASLFNAAEISLSVLSNSGAPFINEDTAADT